MSSADQWPQAESSPIEVGRQLSEGKGHTFESCRVRHEIKDLASACWS